MAEKIFPLGDGILTEEKYGTKSEIKIDTSFYDNISNDMLFRKIDIDKRVCYDIRKSDNINDKKLTEILKKIQQNNMPDENGKINGQDISSGGIKSLIDAIIKIFSKIFGFLIEQIVVFVRNLLDLNYTSLIKTPLDIAATTYCSTPGPTSNPPGIAYLNSVKFSKDIKKQMDTISSLKKMIQEFIDIIKGIPEWVGSKITEPTKDLKFAIPSMPLMGAKDVIPGNDFYKNTKDKNKEKTDKKNQGKPFKDAPVNIFDLSNLKIGNKTIDLDLASLLISPFTELKKIIPTIESPNLTGTTISNFEMPKMNDVEYLDQFNEYTDISGVTTFNIVNFYNKFDQIVKVKKSKFKMCDVKISETETVPFTFWNDLNSLNVPEKYNTIEKTMTTDSGNTTFKSHSIDDVKKYIMDLYVSTDLIKIQSFQKFLIRWINKNSKKLEKNYKQGETIIKGQAVDLTESKNWQIYLIQVNKKNFKLNNSQINDLFIASIDFLDLNFYKSKYKKDYDDMILEYLTNIDRKILPQFNLLVKLYSDIFKEYQDCNLMDNKEFKNLIQYPDSEDFKDAPQVPNEITDIKKYKQYLPEKVSAALMTVDFIKGMIIMPVNLVLGYIKDFLNIIKNTITLNIPKAIDGIKEFFKNLVPSKDSMFQLVSKIFSMPTDNSASSIKIKDILQNSLPEALLKVMRLLIHKLFDTLIKTIGNWEQESVKDLGLYASTTTFPGTVAFIAIVKLISTGLQSAIKAILSSKSDVQLGNKKVFSELIV